MPTPEEILASIAASNASKPAVEEVSGDADPTLVDEAEQLAEEKRVFEKQKAAFAEHIAEQEKLFEQAMHQLRIEQQAATLASGGSTAARVQVLGPKTYYTQNPNSNIHVMRAPGVCEAIAFVGNRLDTEDAAVIAHMELIADRPGSGVYTKRELAFQKTSEEIEMQHDVADAAAAAHRKMLAAGERTA